jgi:hypothetical protein
MKTVIIASLVLASTAFAQASEVTILARNVPATRGYTKVNTKFHVDMKEAFAKISVNEEVTVYVRNCNYGPKNPRYPQPYHGRYCQTYPQTQINTIFSDKVKIEGMTMNGDDVIYQDAEGDVVCGTMGRSRVFRVPTFYLSGKCDLVGKIMTQNVVQKLTVKFVTK